MQRVVLFHWKPDEAPERLERLRRAGYRAEYNPGRDMARYRALRDDPPDAVVIDLARLPSHGRELAGLLRQQKATRHLPIVFIAGDADKTARVRALLPDAVYATWRGIKGALARALARPPADPVVPGGIAGYAGTPLPAKLGITAGSSLTLLGAPPEFAAALGPLPGGVTVRRTARGRSRRVIAFLRSPAELARRLPVLIRAMEPGGGLWIAWPKGGSAKDGRLTEGVVRRTGLAAGLVDYKICAIDAVWSGLLFARRGRP